MCKSGTKAHVQIWHNCPLPDLGFTILLKHMVVWVSHKCFAQRQQGASEWKENNLPNTFRYRYSGHVCLSTAQQGLVWHKSSFEHAQNTISFHFLGNFSHSWKGICIKKGGRGREERERERVRERERECHWKKELEWPLLQFQWMTSLSKSLMIWVTRLSSKPCCVFSRSNEELLCCTSKDRSNLTFNTVG